MIIAHLSDFHLFATKPEVSIVRPDIAEVVAAIVADLCKVSPDVVVISGDLTCGGSEGDYELALSLLQPLDCPVLVVPGNHDRRENFRAAFDGRLPFSMDGFNQFTMDLSGVRFIGLDTADGGLTYGRLCQKRLDWLERQIRRETPCFLILHHPPFPTGNRAWDGMGMVEGQERLAELISGQPVRLLCGHVHRSFHTVWNGVYGAVAGSPAFQFDLGMDQQDEPATVTEPYRYYLHHVNGDGAVRVFDQYPKM